MAKFFCWCCGDEFTPEPEELKMFLNGETQKPDLCEECFQMQSNFIPDYIEYSDADNGL